MVQRGRACPVPSGPHTAEQNEKGVETRTMKKRILSFALALALSLSLAAPAFAVYETQTFSDVPKSHWAYTYVEQAAEKDWISGSNGYFMPDQNVTYAQMCVMLVSAFFNKELMAYIGPSQPWYEPSCVVASRAGLLKNTSIEKNPTDTAKVNQPCTRQEMALIIYNSLKSIGATMPSSDAVEATAMNTPDMAYYLPQYITPVATIKATGIINGVDSKGTFSGRDNMTRSQAAVVMVNLDKYLNGTGAVAKPTGNRDFNGYTLAAGVRTSVGKNDTYKTKGHSDSPSRNGYFTKADLDIGKAQLVYDLLDMVNEARRAEGLHEYLWVTTDEEEEYTLLRAYELITKWSHIRPGDKYSFMGENIATGYKSALAVFNGWMNSPGHRAAIMDDTCKTMCVARCGDYWVMTFGGSLDGNPLLVEHAADNYTYPMAEASFKKQFINETRCANCGYIMSPANSDEFDTNSSNGEYQLCSTCHNYFVCGQCLDCPAFLNHIANCKG